MSVKETEKKCPKCGRKLNKILDTTEMRKHIGYFCNNCGIPFKIEEIN